MVSMAYDKGSLLLTLTFLQPLNPFSSQENHRLFTVWLEYSFDIDRSYKSH